MDGRETGIKVSEGRRGKAKSTSNKEKRGKGENGNKKEVFDEFEKLAERTEISDSPGSDIPAWIITEKDYQEMKKRHLE